MKFAILWTGVHEEHAQLTGNCTVGQDFDVFVISIFGGTGKCPNYSGMRRDTRPKEKKGFVPSIKMSLVEEMTRILNVLLEQLARTCPGREVSFIIIN